MRLAQNSGGPRATAIRATARRSGKGREGSLYRRHEELTATQTAYCRSVGCVLLADAREEGSEKRESLAHWGQTDAKSTGCTFMILGIFP